MIEYATSVVISVVSDGYIICSASNCALRTAAGDFKAAGSLYRRFEHVYVGLFVLYILSNIQ